MDLRAHLWDADWVGGFAAGKFYWEIGGDGGLSEVQTALGLRN